MNVQLGSRRAFARILAGLAFLALCAASALAAPPLKAGDRLVFLGDSITEQRVYTRYVMDYFTLRYPGVEVTFRNAGWSGDRAPGGLKRLERDVLSQKPTVVSICFGMNDGGYKGFEEAGYKTYMDGMTGLVDELTKAGVKTVLLTPGCVDPDRNNKPGFDVYNDTLTRYAKGVLELGEKNKLASFDLDALMLDVQKKAKADDPQFTMIPDGVHPSAPGQAVMAYALLKALGCADQASGLAIDAEKSKATPDRCKVTDLKVAPDSVTFTRSDDALPTFLDGQVRDRVGKYLPFDADLNRYMLTVTGLKAGDWVLTVEGTTVGVFPAADLAKGVDLSAKPGPWADLARKVSTIANEQENLYFTAWRSVSLINVPDAAKPELDALKAKMDKAVQDKEAERLKAVPAERAWKWELKALPAPVAPAAANP